MARKKKPAAKKYLYRNQVPSRKPKKLLRWVLGGIIFTVMMIFLTGNRSLLKLHSLQQEKQKLEDQRETLIKQNQNLQEEIDKLKNDQEYIEKVAREKYNMKKEGEEVYIIERK
jgi:cell division protein FtsB